MTTVAAPVSGAYPSASVIQMAARSISGQSDHQVDWRGNQVEDYMQELHLRLWQAFQKPHEHVGYLRLTLWNTVKNFRKRRPQPQALELSETIPDTSPRPDQVAEVGSLISYLESHLTEDEVSLLEVVAGEGSRGEQAKQLGVSRSKLFLDISRTRRKAARLLEEEAHV